MTMLLSIAVRNFSEGRKVQIREQYSRDIDYLCMQTGIHMLCASVPDLEKDAFYLRGDDEDCDEIWLYSPYFNSLNFVITLAHYAKDMAASISIESSREEVVFNIYTTKIGDIPKVIDYYDAIDKINHLKLSDDKFQFKPQACEKCGEKSEDCQRIAYEARMTVICARCMEKALECDYCHMFYDKLKKTVNSLSVEKNVCRRCDKKVVCSTCQFEENQNDVSCYRSIDEEGNTQDKDRNCLKCSSSNLRCKRCGYDYPSNYPKCPCLIPKTFQDLGLEKHDANVLHFLQGDYDAEIGMEFEVGVKCSNRLKYEEIYNHTKEILAQDAITVYDSSIDYIDKYAHPPLLNSWRGFEIVTRPLNYDNMMSFVDRLTRERHRDLKCWHVETTGIHIHIARFKNDHEGRRRRFLSDILVGKLLVFINSATNRRLIKHIAQRYNPKFAKLTPKKITDCKDMRKKCHYEALNTNKEHTIEFRIFKGSLKKETVLSYIQFVYSAIEFCRVTSSKELTSARYKAWLGSTNRSSYRHLKQRVATFGIKGQFATGGEE